MFALAVWILEDRGIGRKLCVFCAIAAARLVSSNFNYFYNRFVVFGAKYARKRSFFQYWALVLVIAAASYALTTAISALGDFHAFAVTAVKIVVETFLFFASYHLQKRFIFRKR